MLVITNVRDHGAQYVTSIRHAMIAPLQLVWTEQRTHSLNGKDNANVGHDLGQERMNKNCKQFVSAVVHDIFARLRMVASLLNAFFHIWPRFRRALGKKEKESYERNDFKKSDKNKLLNALKAKLPAANYAAFCAPKRSNVFKSRPAHTVPPWEVVERAVTDGSAAKEEEDNLFVPPTGYDSDDGSAECGEAWYKYVSAYLTKVPRM